MLGEKLRCSAQHVKFAPCSFCLEKSKFSIVGVFKSQIINIQFELLLSSVVVVSSEATPPFGRFLTRLTDAP